MAAAGVSEEAVLSRLRELLPQVDLQTTTERQLRKQLEKEYGVELVYMKASIRAEVDRYLSEGQEEEQQDAEEDTDHKPDGIADLGDEEQEEYEEEQEDDEPAYRSGGGLGSRLSPELQAFLGVESMPRTQVVKRLWEYIKENNLQDPKNKRKIIVDEKLATLFTPPINMFSMNKQLSKHVKTNDYGDGPARPKTPAKPRKRKGSPSEDGEEKKRNTGFTKAQPVSPELSEFLGGKTEISRPDLTKAWWAYIKSNELQNPENKKEIISDAMLLKLTGQERFEAFGFMKYIKQHLLSSA